MKKLLLILFLPALTASAQSIEERKVDKFTGATTILTTRESVAVEMGYPWISVSGYITYDKNDTTPVLLLGFHLKGQRTGSITRGKSSITLLTSSGDAITLPYEGEYKLFIPSDLIVSMYFSVTKEQIQDISRQQITDIRVVTDKQSDYQVKKNKQGVISNVCKVLINEIEK